MAETYVINNLVLNMPHNALVWAAEEGLEGASQTFDEIPTPIVSTSGLLVTAADPVTAIFGFALRAGNNDAGGISPLRFVPVVSGLKFWANHLDTDGTDNVLAAADHGAARQLNFTAALAPDGKGVWHIGDSASTTACRVVSFRNDQHVSAAVEPRYAAAGDTNARVMGSILQAVQSFE